MLLMLGFGLGKRERRGCLPQSWRRSDQTKLSLLAGAAKLTYERYAGCRGFVNLYKQNMQGLGKL